MYCDANLQTQNSDVQLMQFGLNFFINIQFVCEVDGQTLRFDPCCRQFCEKNTDYSDLS